MKKRALQQPGATDTGRLAIAVLLVLLAALSVYRAWFDLVRIGIQDPEQSQVLLALPAALLLLYARRERLAGVPLGSSMLGVATAAAGWALSWYGYMHAVQSLWHLGAVVMAVGAAWAALGNRAMLIALPALIALVALVPVPNLLRQDIALPLQRITASGSEFLLIALGFDVERIGQTLLYQGKPVTIEEACNGMRMVFALVLVCYAYVMAQRLNAFARLLLIGLSPVLAVGCNIIRVVPTVVIYGEFGDGVGDTFHDISGWAMIGVAALMLFGVLRLLSWADIPIHANATPTKPAAAPRRATPLPRPIAPIATALLLLVAAAHTLSMPSAADANPYHRAVARAADATPIRIDGLESRPIEIPEGSLKLLRANTARAVQYTDERTGIGCQFLLIQSKDARDLSGHYPPRCYPNVYGYVLIEQTPRQWVIDGLTIRGTEYTFAESEAPGAPRWVVMHFFALPSGDTTGRLNQMREAAADYLRRHRGAAQVQLMFRETDATPAQRDAMLERVLTAQAPLIRSILDAQAGQ